MVKLCSVELRLPLFRPQMWDLDMGTMKGVQEIYQACYRLQQFYDIAHEDKESFAAKQLLYLRHLCQYEFNATTRSALDEVAYEFDKTTLYICNKYGK